MSFRVFFLCLLPCSWSWSAGVSIELDSTIKIGNLVYVADAEEPLLTIEYTDGLLPQESFAYIGESKPPKTAFFDLKNDKKSIRSRELSSLKLHSNGELGFGATPEGLELYHAYSEFLTRYSIDFQAGVTSEIYDSSLDIDFLFAVDSYQDVWDTSSYSSPSLFAVDNENLVFNWNIDSLAWDPLSQGLDFPEGVYWAEGANESIFLSYYSPEDSGLWEIDLQNTNGSKVSGITLDSSDLYATDLGFLQVYLHSESEVYFNFLQSNEKDLKLTSTSDFKIVNVDFIFDSDGGVVLLYAEGVGVLPMWFNSATGELTLFNIPEEVLKILACEDTNRDPICIVETDNGRMLYKVIGDQLIEEMEFYGHDSIDSIIRLESVVSYDNAHYISIKTGDYTSRLVKVTSDGSTQLLRSSGSDYFEYWIIIPSQEDNKFLWSGFSSVSGTYNFTFHALEVFSVADEEEPVIVFDPDEIRDFDSGVPVVDDEKEEAKEIPRAELSGTLSWLMLINMLLLLSVRRLGSN